jgi:hypothetical protein
MTHRALVAAATLALVAGCGGDTTPEAVKQPQVPVSARVGSAGVTVALPGGWHSATSDDRNVIDPVTRVVAASAPIRPKETACQVAQYDFPADAVALVVLEWREPSPTLPARPARFTNAELPVQPPPAIECFEGSGGSAQFIDHGRSFGAYLLVGPAAPALLVDEARRVLDTLRVADRHGNAGARSLERNGIYLALPAGWDGRILFREPSGRDGVSFQVANFMLPDNAGLEPPRELPPGEEDPIKAMGENDLLVTIRDDAADGVKAPATITVADLADVEGPRVPHGHSLAERSFCFAGRCVSVGVDFGSTNPRSLHVESANEVLASLAVAAPDAGTRRCGQPDYPGPWTACAEAAWVRQVAAEAGYRIVGETGSALVAAGGGDSFYIWTTRLRQPVAALAAEKWQQLGSVGNVPIYGDEHLWRWWAAQGYVFWIQQGPRETSTAPDVAELEPLVSASFKLRAPT